MKLLYSIGIYCYTFFIHIAAIFNSKAKRWVKGRKNWKNNLPNVNDQSVIWFHCASLGEFDQALPLLNQIKETNPKKFIIVTFFSPSGFEHYHKRKHLADFVCYLPADTPSNAHFFVNYFQPELAFFVKYEFWANYIFAFKKSSGKLFSISAIFRENQQYFKPNAKFFPSILKQFDYFFVQDQSSIDLLNSIGIKGKLTGDTRFDKVIQNREQLQPNFQIESFVKGKKAIIIGSCWPLDEAIVLPYLNNSNERFIIAPHDINEQHIKAIIQQLKRPFVRYSQMNSQIESEAEVLILDTIGHLASAYYYGKIAYVGGGFSGSLHNILEPGVFGLPVVFGPKFSRFPEAKMFIQSGIGFSVKNSDELSHALQNIELNLESLNVKTAHLITENKGATSKIYAYLKTNDLVD